MKKFISVVAFLSLMFTVSCSSDVNIDKEVDLDVDVESEVVNNDISNEVEPSTVEDSDLQEEITTWQEEYGKILMDYIEEDHNLYFSLYDFDLDGIKELIVVGMRDEEAYDAVYTYKDYEVTKLEYEQDVFSADEVLAPRSGVNAPPDLGEGLIMYNVGPSAGNFGTNVYYKLIKIDGNKLVIGVTGERIVNIEVLHTLFDDFGRNEEDQEKLDLAIQENTHYYINDKEVSKEVSKEELSEMFVSEEPNLELFEITKDNIENALPISLGE